MSDVPRNRQDLETLWKQRWDEAKRKLELAAIHVEQIEQQTRSGDAYRQALEAEILAAAEYSRVLRIYTDLVVYGDIPDAPADDQCKTNNAGAE